MTLHVEAATVLLCALVLIQLEESGWQLYFPVHPRDAHSLHLEIQINILCYKMNFCNA